MASELISSANIPREAVKVDVHAPDSLTLYYSGDLRSTLMAGRTFVMQVAHPQVGAGVGQLSNFRNDPWHRLREISKSGERFMFSGRAAGVEEGRRLRELHRNIKGVDAQGNKFHSLQPSVYGWVHTVFLDTAVTQARLFGPRLQPGHEARLFEEWRESGRLFGLRDQDMPATLEQYWRHYNDMIADTLDYNEVIDTMLNLQAPPPSSLSWLPSSLWKTLWQPISTFNRTLTLATLPPAFRAKISAHQAWQESDEQQMEKFARRVNALVSRLPERLRYTRQGYRARHRAADSV